MRTARRSHANAIITGALVGLTLSASLGSLPAFGATRTSTFAHIDPGVRATALGGAYSALGGDPIAMYWNPATLFYQDGREVEASYSDIYGLGLARRTFLTLGIKSVIEQPRFEGDRVVVQKDRETGSAYAVGVQSLFLDLEENGYSELSLGGGAAWGYGDRLAVGLALHTLFITSDLDQVSAFGYNIGMGVAVRHAPNARIGVSIPRLLSRVFWDFDSTERLPLGITLGWTRNLRHNLLLAADLEWREEGGEIYRAAAGGEWWLARKRLALRAGYRHISGGLEDINEPSFGVGFRISRLQFDYAFRMEPEALGDTHRLGIMVGF
jgi:hypothetical protein